MNKRLQKIASALAAVALALAAALVSPYAAAAEDLNCTGHDTYSSSLVAEARARVAAGSDAAAIQSAPGVPGGWRTGNASVGSDRVVVIRVSFPAGGGDDAMTFPADQDPETLRSIFNGAEDEGSSSYPYESLHAYYKRASYDKLDIEATAVVDYTARYNRSHYTDDVAELFREAVHGVDDEVDFSQCDGNGDGYIDGVYLQFAGTTGTWGTTWWPTEYPLSADAAGEPVDGKTLCSAVLLDSQDRGDGGAWLRRTVIHETGHLLGLPDLYNYDNQSSASGLGLQTFGMMSNNTGDVDAYSKWMLGWVDPGDITYVRVTSTGVDVRRAGSDKVERVDGDASVILAALEQAGQDGRPGFLAVSNDAAVLDGNLFCNFYLVQYAKAALNDTVPDLMTSHGFRLYRVQGGLSEDGALIHTNTNGGIHMQLIEGLAPSGPQSAFSRFWSAGSSLTPTTDPSTNFGESLVKGYSGVAVALDGDTGDEGTVRVSYEAKSTAGELKATCATKGPIPACGSVEIKLSEAASLSEDSYGMRPTIVADGKEYKASSASYDEGERTLTVPYRLPATVSSSAKLSLKIPAGYFISGYDEQGGEVGAPELTCDLPQVDSVAIDASGTYAEASRTGWTSADSDLFEAAGSMRFLFYRGPNDAADDARTGELLLCTVAADGKSVSAKTVAVPGGLPVKSAGISVLPLTDGTVFARLRFSNSRAMQAVDLLIDPKTGAVLASRETENEQEVAASSTLIELDGGVGCIASASGVRVLYTYTRDGAKLDVAAEQLAAVAGSTGERVVEAGDGYMAALCDRVDGEDRGEFVLRRRPRDAPDIATGEPEVRIEIPGCWCIHAVRVANGRVYAWVTDYIQNGDGGGKWSSALVEYDLEGNLIKRTEADELLGYSQTAAIRVSKTGAVAVCVDLLEEGQSPIATTPMRVFLFDDGLDQAGKTSACAPTVGAWIGNRWLAVDRYNGDAGFSKELNWYLTEPVGKTADDPEKPGDGGGEIGDHGGGKGGQGGTGQDGAENANGGGTASGKADGAVDPSAKASAATARSAKGALANTGDRTLELVAALATLGLAALAAAAGIILARRRR